MWTGRIQHTHTHTHRLDFTMCNPPFYASHQEVLASASAKEFAPHAVSSQVPFLLSLVCVCVYVSLSVGAERNGGRGQKIDVGDSSLDR